MAVEAAREIGAGSLGVGSSGECDACAGGTSAAAGATGAGAQAVANAKLASTEA